MLRQIHRRARRGALATLAIGLLLSTIPGAAQPNLDQVEIKAIEVADGIYMLTGAGGNLGALVGDDGVVLIDDQFAPLSDKIQAAVKKLSDQPIRFVFNTHWHGDHTGGNENLGKAGAVVVAHDNVRERMSVENLSDLFGKTPPSPPGALPVVTFSETVTFHMNGEEIYVFHVPPAHTDGDSIIYFKTSDVLHMGDLYFNGLYPFIDVWSGGTVDGFIAAVEKVVGMVGENTKVIPGHGPLSNRAELATYLENLKKFRAAVAIHVDAGKSLEETLAAKPTAEWDEALGGSFLNPKTFVTILYKGLTGAVGKE